jgi:hypothetical protein
MTAISDKNKSIQAEPAAAQGKSQTDDSGPSVSQLFTQLVLRPSAKPRLQLRHEPGIKDSELAKYVYLERRANEGTQTYSKMSQYSELPEQYQPRSRHATFQVPVISVPRDRVVVFTANPSPALLRKFVHPKTVSFCVHPAILGDSDIPHMRDLLRMSPDTPLTATPTASSRTMVVIDPENPPFNVKAHCPYKISRFVRCLGPRTIQHSLTVSHELEQIRHPRFAILPETIGCSLPAVDDQNGWGFIIRELTPRPYVRGQRRLIPCFAMYGKDCHHPDEPPLLVKLIERSGQKPMDYVLNNVMFPIIECFLTAFKERGILMESHGQNTLLEVDEAFNITRVVHRDFDEEVDAQVRRRLGLSMDGFMASQVADGPTADEPKGAPHSVIFDKSVGKLHLDYLAKTMQEYYGIPPEQLQRKCQAFFARCMPDHERYFSSEIYVYSDKPTTQNVYPLVGTGQTPVWRPQVPLRAML